MSTARTTPELDVDGPAAPPRDNGELVFTAPWQARTFGTTLALVEAGTLGWERFRTGLVAAIAEDEHDADFEYWRCWARALERVLVEDGALDRGGVGQRVAVLVQRPAGHDHGGAAHGHGH